MGSFQFCLSRAQNKYQILVRDTRGQSLLKFIDQKNAIFSNLCKVSPCHSDHVPGPACLLLERGPTLQPHVDRGKLQNNVTKNTT